jgi:hypothetical protein
LLLQYRSRLCFLLFLCSPADTEAVLDASRGRVAGHVGEFAKALPRPRCRPCPFERDATGYHPLFHLPLLCDATGHLCHRQKNWPPLLHLLPIASAHGFACTSRTTLSRLRHLSPSSAAMRAAPAGPALSSRRGDPPWPPSSAPPWTTHSEAFSFPSNHCFVVPWLLWCS